MEEKLEKILLDLNIGYITVKVAKRKILRLFDVSVSVCSFYMSGNDTSGKCNNCGKNKLEH